MLELAPLDATLIHCFAEEEALATLTIASPSFLGVVAPREAVVVAPSAGAASSISTIELALARDPNALVIDLTDAYEGVSLTGDYRSAFARCADWRLPEPPSIFSQGLVAELAAKLISTPEQLFIFVGSNVGHHLRKRLHEACADLEIRDTDPLEFRWKLNPA